VIEHAIKEFFCAFLGLGIYGMMRPIVKARPELKGLYWLGQWGLWCGTLSLAHAYLSAFSHYPPESTIPLTYLPERVADSMFAMLAAYPGLDLDRKFLGLSKDTWIHLGLLTAFSVVVYLGLQGQQAMFTGAIGRPQEMLQVLPAAIVLGRLMHVSKAFGTTMKWSTLATLLGGCSMLFSHELFDVPFKWAHTAKVLSYCIMFYTVLWVRKLHSAGKA